jgi:O-antigen/teichoic acid export membrane protein
MAARQGLGAVLNAGGILLLTRLIGPGAYGVFAAALGLYMYVHLVAQWGAQLYLVRRPGEEQLPVYHVAFTYLLAAGVVALAVAAGAAWLLERWTLLPGLGAVGLVLAFGLPLHLVGCVPLARLERALDFRSAALIELIGLATFFTVALPLAALGAGVWSPAAGWVTQQGVVAGLCFRAADYRPRLVWRQELGREMLGYGLGYSASIWIWQLRRLVNPVIVGRYLGAEVVGIVALTVQIVSNLSFVANAAWRLSAAALARIQDDGPRLVRVIGEGMRLQALAVGPFLLVFGWLAPWLVPTLFGEAWRPVVLVYPFIALAYYFIAMFNLHSSALYVRQHNWDLALFHAVHTTLFAGSALLLVPRLGLIGYGWAELITLLGYGVVHAMTVRRIGSPAYRLVVPATVAFSLAFFYPWLGWLSGIGLLAMVLWPGTWRDARTLLLGWKELAYER